jgi:hypothetical protein
MLNVQNKKFRIPVVFSFMGEFFITAPSQTVAEKYVKEHCGLSIGELHSTLPEGDVDWNFDCHPARKVGRAKPIRKKIVRD